MNSRNKVMLSIAFIVLFTLGITAIPTANPSIQTVFDTPISSLATQNILWNTTADFESYSTNNCTIETNQLTLKEVGTTYDFTDGSLSEWTIEKGNDTDVTVVASKAGHSKVVEIWDNSDPNNILMYQTFADQTNGTIEFWIYGIEGTDVWRDYLDIRFMSESLAIENFRLQADWDSSADDLIQYGTDDVIVGSGNFTSDIWHHIRVWWNCTSDKFKVWHNTEYKGEFTMRYTQWDNVDSIIFQTHPSYSKNNFYTYLDAIDYSWTTDYYTERSYDHYGERYYSKSIWESTSQNLQDNNPYYNNITFSSQINVNTSVYISYRDSQNDKAWSNWTAWSSSTISLNKNGHKYIQVRTLLNTSNQLQTPELEWINFCYNT